jgi:hypothetical protein
MAEALPERFCLKANPYSFDPPAPEFRSIADSPRMVATEELLQLGGLDAYLKSRIGNKEAAIVLVVGREYTGRTTVARNILNRYARTRGITQAANFLLPSAGSINHVPMEGIKQWLEDLDLLMTEPKITLDGDLGQSLTDMSALPPEELEKSPLKKLLKQVAVSLDKQGRAFGVYLDGVPPGSGIVQKVTEVFAPSPTVVVATETLIDEDAGTDVFPHFLRLEREKKGYIVRLNLLDKDSALQVARRIWEDVHPEAICPTELPCRLNEKLKNPLPEVLDR